MATTPHSAIVFHRFSDLAAELRDAIWEQCLPSRVVDLDIPSHKFQRSDIVLEDDEFDLGPYCDWTDLVSTKASAMYRPRIATVCREARAVALRYGAGWLKLDKFSRVWLDPGRDVLNFNWRPKSLQPHHLINLYDYVVPLSPVVGSLAKRVAITSDLCRSRLAQFGFMHKEYMHMLLAPRKEYDVSLGTVVIHVDGGSGDFGSPWKQWKRPPFAWSSEPFVDEEDWDDKADEEDGQSEHQRELPDSDPIVDSGLFGLFGEARVQQVDVRDHARLARYAAFNQEHGKSSDYRASKFFSKFSTYDVKRAMIGLEIGWIESPMKQAGILITDQESRDKLFIRRHLTVEEPNYDDPWVQEMLKTMPEFRPVWTIRVCTEKCDVRR